MTRRAYSYPRCRACGSRLLDAEIPAGRHAGCPAALARPRLRAWESRRADAQRATAARVEAATGYPGVRESRAGLAAALAGEMKC